MFAPFKWIMDSMVTSGNLCLIDASGHSNIFGDGAGEPVVARITDKRLERQLAIDPALALGEGYMDGRFVMERGSIYDFLDLVLRNAEHSSSASRIHGTNLLRMLTKRIQQFNPASRAKRNVSHHYDIDGRIYDLFLDKDRQYSCAYFEHGSDNLDEAQQAKKRHLAAKLYLKDGQNVLDIGSGWGGLGLYLARTAHVSVKGITLSEEQLKISRERANKSGLSKAVEFELRDYRNLAERFDRIVSVGMFEHVGVGHYKTFFQKIYDLLRDDGVAVLHSIGRFDGPSTTNPFIAKYIFPGGYIPALSELIPIIERSNLLITDIEILRLHYADTLRHWRHRFLSSWGKAASILDERFCRMWEFYLAGSEVAFRYQGLMVFQIQLAKHQNALPLTRDYMLEAEQRLRQLDMTQTRDTRSVRA